MLFDDQVWRRPIAKQVAEKVLRFVIAVWNEAENIERLLESISNQQCEFPFEIIVSDDESTDLTLARAKAFKERSSVDVRIISSSGAGKKQALTSAVAITDAEIIIVTDGDCMVPESWVQGHTIRYQNEEVQFVAGMVTYKKQLTLLGALLETELIFLQVASGALFHLGRPTMCNGASMSFRRSFFQSIGGFQSDTRVSGDDLSLLSRAAQRGNGSVAVDFCQRFCSRNRICYDLVRSHCAREEVAIKDGSVCSI